MTNPSMDSPPKATDAVAFLQRFHPQGPWHLVAIAPDGPIEARSFTQEKVEAALQWIERHQGKSNLYFHVNRLRQGFKNAKAKKADVVAALYLHVDIDDPSPEVLKRLTTFTPRPTAVVASGGGFHVYFALAVPSTDLDRVERRNHGLEQALGGDNCRNVDRIMRLPGTLNLPNKTKKEKGRTVTAARLIDELTDWSRKYALDAFREAEVGRSLAPAAAAQVRPIDLAALPSISDFTKTLIVKGDDPDSPIGSNGARYPSRSEAVFRVACDLVHAGCSDEMIAGILVNAAYKISASVLEKQNSTAYALRQAVSARRSVAGEWPDVDKGGRPRPTFRNAMLAITRLGVHCECDAFHNRKKIQGKILQEYAGDLSDDLCARIRTHILELFNFDPGKDHVRDAANALCLDNTYNPVRDYLNGLKWDGKPRIDTWLADYMGAEATPLNNAIGRKMLLAGVRRVRQPGVKFDQIIVLEWRQGSGKSTALWLLAGGDEYFSDADILSVDSKAQMEALEGVWIFELSELEGLSRSDTNKAKAFASRKVDRGRPAYGRFREDRPRQNIFVGTTNEDTYLRDQTGNRRFWPVRTGSIDLGAVERDRDQLWAEAAHYEARRESLNLPEEMWPLAQAEQEARVEEDPWFDVLSREQGESHGNMLRVFTEDLLTLSLKIPPDRQHQGHSKRLSRIMHKLGWDGPKRIRQGNKVVRGYERPATKEDEGREPTNLQTI